MGFMDSLKGQMDTIRKYELKQELGLDAVYALLDASLDKAECGPMQLKKGLMGQQIVFEERGRAIPTVTVKGTTVTVKKVVNDSNTHVSVGGMSFRTNKDQRGMKATMNTADIGSAYFKTVADAVGKALEGK